MVYIHAFLRKCLCIAFTWSRWSNSTFEIKQQSVNKPLIIFYLSKYFFCKHLVALPTAAYVEAWVCCSWLQECRRILKENQLGTWKVCHLLYFFSVCKHLLHNTVNLVCLRLCTEQLDTHTLLVHCKMWSISISVLEGKIITEVTEDQR
jgi:hypothetical protein